ncbi:MAG: HAD family phosphatase [Myxococcales bacterium]|nr:MAG: HAD family phosphatase [Myxococcales bacterium]
MKALTELPAQVCKQVHTVAFDVDDTVTQHGQLLAQSYAAIWSLRDAGLRLVAVTGRPLGWAQVFASLWPVDLAIGENGAGWFFRKADTLSNGFFLSESERKKERDLLEQVKQAVAKQLPDTQLSEDQPLRGCDLAFYIGEKVKLSHAQIEELAQTIRSVGAKAVHSTVHMHAFWGEYNKATGIVAAAKKVWNEKLEQTRNAWCFIGDSPNDQAAFAYFPHSIGVANVKRFAAELKSKPSYVTEQSHGEGFAEFAQLFLKKRKS